ncbi:hypothetical protein BJ166DRAFT_235465 [Pestalotiopsis sp. NC0098]|nr:hypothetical protein BJ166DRAFT_235465 [Pestalotiopsis sp. NC0098]
MLLNVDGCFDGFLESIPGAMRFANALQIGSLRSSFLLLSKLKAKRNQTKYMALTHLGNKEIQRCKLDQDDVLDYHGIDVVDCLNNVGINVPATLKNSFLKSARRRSIHHTFSSRAEHDQPDYVAQLIFDLGFRNIDEPDEKGQTPLMLICKWHTRPELRLWFVEHGADLTLRYPCSGSRITSHAHVNPTVAQQVFELLRRPSAPERLKFQRATLITRVVPVTITDDCECYCTQDGCCPASILFWDLWKQHQGWKIPHTEVGSKIAQFLESSSLNLTSHRHVCLTALRILTFEALEISHTCGCGRLSDEPALNNDEFGQAWDEEAHLIGRLEELQAEFEAAFDALGKDFSTFLTTEWAPRVENALRRLDEDQLSEAERTGAEALGVKWQAREEDERGGESNAIVSVEDFFRALREIEKE